MRKNRMLVLVVMMYSFGMAAGTILVYGASLGETNVQVTPENEVRYTTGKTIYVEALVEGRWVGHYWSADGRANVPHQGRSEDAFELQVVMDDPTSPARFVSTDWQWVSASELPRTEKGARHFAVELSNSTHPIRVKVHTLLDGTPVLTRWLDITNTSSKPLALVGICPWSGRLWSREAPVKLGHSLNREVPWEGWFGWKPLEHGVNLIKNDSDRLWDDPYFVLQNESNREYFFGQLAWAANYSMEFHKDKGLSFKIGPIASKVLRVIFSGETVKTPSVHLGHVKGDFDTAVQAMHEHIRRSVLPTRKLERSYLVQYLIPEDWPMTVYRGDEFNEENMKKCIDVAAAVGIEAFILDGPMWGSAYGNWLVPDKKRFPRGLSPLVEYAHKKGLLFGLYVESEGGRDGFTSKSGDGAITIGGWKESKVYKEHPEWFTSLNLNLAVPEAAAYLESEVSQIIDFYKLDIYRHDQNGIVFFPPGPGACQTLRDMRFVESNYWRHYEAFNGIFERIHARYPDLILQQAAAGNFRLDLGSASVFHEQFTSDRATMPYVYRMLAGMSVYLPPETLVNSNGMAWPKDQPDLDTTLRGAYALANTPMIFNFILPKSVEELKPEIREKFLHYANLYKSFIRPLIPTCHVYHHAPVSATGGVESGDWFAMEFTSADRQKGWAVVIRLSKSASGEYLFKPKGLDGKRKYSVTFDNTGKAETFEGGRLMRDGLPIRLEGERASELLLIETK